jgi:YVTN family beta-propeller protein
MDAGAWGITVLPDGSRWYATGSGNDTVVSFDERNFAVRVISTGLSSPYGIVASPDGKRVYVANAGNATVAVIDTQTDDLVATVPVDAGPYALALTPDGRKLFATSTPPIELFAKPADAIECRGLRTTPWPISCGSTPIASSDSPQRCR